MLLNNNLIMEQQGIKHSKVFHQNIRGLRYKLNELLCHLHNNLPHIVCLTEHHLNDVQMISSFMENYSLGAYYSKKQLIKDGTCIFVHNSLKFTTLKLEKY